MNRSDALAQAEAARRGSLNDLGNLLRNLVDAVSLEDPLSLSKQPAPETATDTATLTTDQMLSGILVGTPTAAAAYTTPTGTAIEAALRAAGFNVEADDSFDLTIINIGATTFDITLTAGTDVSIVGSAVVRPSADAATEEAGQGTFRFRRSAENTFIAYRVA